MRLDCFPVSLTTWLDNCDANADLDLVTDRANLANLLSPPEKAAKTLNETREINSFLYDTIFREIWMVKAFSFHEFLQLKYRQYFKC